MLRYCYQKWVLEKEKIIFNNFFLYFLSLETTEQITIIRIFFFYWFWVDFDLPMEQELFFLPRFYLQSIPVYKLVPYSKNPTPFICIENTYISFQ